MIRFNLIGSWSSVCGGALMPRRLAGTFVFLFLCSCVVSSWHGVRAAEDPPIVVNGNRHFDADMIRAHFHARADGTYDAAALDAALKGLYGTGLFDDVKIVRQGEHILVSVVENPT